MYIVTIGGSINCNTALIILIATYEFLHAEVFKSVFSRYHSIGSVL
jgi:hypothetical protein